MADPILNAVTQPVLQQAIELQTRSPTEAASAQDTAQFSAALQGGDPSSNVDASQVNPVTETDGVQPRRTIGEAILDGIQDAKNTYDMHAKRVSTQLSTTSDSGMSVQDTMKLQYELIQMNLQQDLTTKVADKTSQGVQTLFKNQ